MKSPAWIFDIDDTLYLERDYVQSGFRAVDGYAVRHLKIYGIYDLAWSLFLAGCRRTVLTEAFAAAGEPLDATMTTEVVRVYREHVPDIRLCPDARDFLEMVGTRCAVGVISDGPTSSQMAKVQKLRLDAYADVIILTDEHGPEWHKPSVVPFKHISDALGAEPSQCTYVADNPLKDFAGPRKLGWRTVRIARLHGLHANLSSMPGEVDRTDESFTELIREMQWH